MINNYKIIGLNKIDYQVFISYIIKGILSSYQKIVK